MGNADQPRPKGGGPGVRGQCLKPARVFTQEGRAAEVGGRRGREEVAALPAPRGRQEAALPAQPPVLTFVLK
jgi:hypothetical protein